MANRLVKLRDELVHYYETCDSCGPSLIEPPVEADKTKSLSDMTQREIYKLLERLRSERDVQNIVRDLRRSAGMKDTYENPAKIDTVTPINQMYHHGILGQKWGVLRFQREDGSRTPAGKKRDEARHNPKSSPDYRESRASLSKGTKGLSNAELRKLNERLQLEAMNKSLTAEKIQKSESWVKQAIQDGSKQALTSFTKGVALGAAKLLVQQMSPSFAETAFQLKEKKD